MMKTRKLFLALIFLPVVASANSADTAGNTGYIAGVVLALLILAYLVYSLMKPENF